MLLGAGASPGAAACRIRADGVVRSGPRGRRARTLVEGLEVRHAVHDAREVPRRGAHRVRRARGAVQGQAPQRHEVIEERELGQARM